jgi:hypothetical protein
MLELTPLCSWKLPVIPFVIVVVAILQAALHLQQKIAI